MIINKWLLGLRLLFDNLCQLEVVEYLAAQAVLDEYVEDSQGGVHI